jgi:hypothetical protein
MQAFANFVIILSVRRHASSSSERAAEEGSGKPRHQREKPWSKVGKSKKKERKKHDPGEPTEISRLYTTSSMADVPPQKTLQAYNPIFATR